MDGNGRETFVIYLVLAGEGPMGGGRMQCALSRPSSLIQTLNRVEQKQNSVINKNLYMNTIGRSQTLIGSELLEDKEIHNLNKILDRIVKQLSPEEQDKLEDAEVFIGYYHD